MPYQPNPGHLPGECILFDEAGEITGYRAVHVRLFGGFDSRAAGHAPWPAAGSRPPTVWTISRKPHAFEIKEWEPQ